MSHITVLLLAAGASTRMRGVDKLLENVDGMPLLRLLAKAALETGAHVIVALAPDRPKRVQALTGLRVQCIRVENASEGMGASIRTVAESLSSDTRALAVLPADMPEMASEDLCAVLAASDAHPDRIVRGMSSSGVPGHPVVFPSRLFAELAVLSGDEGGRSILEGEDVHPVPLPGMHAVTDLDTPEAWEAWRSRLKLQSFPAPREGCS